MTSSDFTVGITWNCKHYMPCGWCDLKNEMCTQTTPIQIPQVPYEPYNPIRYGYEVTCNAERSEE